MAELKSIPLSKIDMIKNYRDVEPVTATDPDVIELAGSISKLGVLQPALVRPKHHSRDRYELIFGHRRYVACGVAGLAEMPCNVMNVADDEILELQVTENLQRKDVHPMDEAIAFKTLMDLKHDKPEDLSVKFGKSVTFIRQRLRLNELAPDWQKIFLRNKISITDALRVGALAVKDQKDLLDSQNLTKEELKTGRFAIEIRPSELAGYKGDLARAGFDITDPLLDKKMGACTSCTYNTACAALFPESAQNAHCTNTACFKSKTEKAFKTKIGEAQADPKIIFISTDHNPNKKELAVIEKDYSVEVLLYGNFNVLEDPEQPEYDNFLDEIEWDIDAMSPEEIKKDWNDTMASYQNKLAEYEAKVANGRYKKALVVSGVNKGRFIYITLSKKKAPSSGSQITEKGETTPPSAEERIGEIDTEINGIEVRQARALELDLEKIHRAMVEELKSNPVPQKPGLKHMGQVDRGLLVFLLIHELARMSDDEIRADLKKKLPKEPEHDKARYEVEYINALGSIDDNDLAYIVRKICYEKYASRNLQYGISVEDATLRLIAEYAGLDLLAIEAAQRAEAAKRIERADKRVEALKKEKKELVSQSKSKKANNQALSKGIKSLLEDEPSKKKIPVKKAASKKGSKNLLDMTDEELDDVQGRLSGQITDDVPDDID